MKVWELIEKLSNCKAGADINMGAPKERDGEENVFYYEIKDIQNDDETIYLNLNKTEDFTEETKAA